MKNKAMEFVERHVEKALLAAGIIFMGWMGYHNFIGSPNAVHLENGTGPLVAPGQVGPKITTSVNRLWRQIQHAEKIKFHHIQRVDYVARLQLSAENPLPGPMLAMSQARFAPYNTGIANTGLSQIKGLVFRAPELPTLAAPAAKQARGVAELSATKTKDVVWVKLSGVFPTRKWLASMASKVGLRTNEEPLPAAYRRTIFYRVQVRRQALEPSGEWGPWKMIKGTYLQALPSVHNMAALGSSGRIAARSAIEAAQQDITDPVFYTIEQIRQRIVTPAPTPVHRPIVHPMGGGEGGPPLGGFPMPNMSFFGGGGGGFSPPGMQQMRQQQQRAMRQEQLAARAAQQRALAAQKAQQARMEQPTAGNGFPMPMFPGYNSQMQGQSGVHEALAANADVPLRFYDTSVEPGKTYRYEMRVKLLNPVYKVGFHLTDPAVADRPWLVSSWSDPSQRVRVSANLYFYLISSQIINDQVDFRIFKWVHGVWAVTSEYVSPGEPIGNTQSIPMVDPQTGNLKATQINFDTRYQLVDAQAMPNGSINVVVLTPQGQLEIRNSEIDATDPEQQKLIKATMDTGSPSAATNGAGGVQQSVPGN